MTLPCPRCVVFRAANYVDRILSVRKVDTGILEGLSWLCFYLAESVGDLRNRRISYVKMDPCIYYRNRFVTTSWKPITWTVIMSKH